MLRVLQVLSRLSLNTGVMGFLLNYYRHIDRSKIQFDFLYFLDKDQNIYDEIIASGGRVFHIEKPSASAKSIKNIENFFKEHRNEYPIVHNHEVYLTFAFSPISKKYGTKAFISHSHTTVLSANPISRVRNHVLCLPVNQMSDYCFACSNDAGIALFGSHKWNKECSLVIPNAIDTERFRYRAEVRQRVRAKLGLEGNLVVGHVGRFQAPKNQRKLIEIFLKINELIPESRLLLVGDGPDRPEIEQMVKKLGLSEKVLFLGTCNQVEDMYQAMDTFIFPSFYEGLGIALIEAQCSGLPCIASSKVPKDACVTSSFSFMSLADSAKAWANAAIAHPERIPDTGLEQVIAHGYDITTAAKRFENIYLRISRNESIDNM